MLSEGRSFLGPAPSQVRAEVLNQHQALRSVLNATEAARRTGAGRLELNSRRERASGWSACVVTVFRRGLRNHASCIPSFPRAGERARPTPCRRQTVWGRR